MEWIKTIARCGGCDASMSITYFRCPKCMVHPTNKNVVIYREEDLPDICSSCGSTVKGVSSIVKYEGITL